MPSTASTRLRVEKQELGENLNTWGNNRLNDALERLDEAIAGVSAVTIAGASTVLTSVNYAADQARRAALVFTGTLAAASTVTVPNVEKLYLVVDNTTRAGFTLTLKTAAGSGYALRPGPQWVYCDGTDVYRAGPRLDQMPLPTAALDANSQKISNLATGTLGGDAINKTQFDAAVSLLASQVDASAAIAAANSATASASSASTSASTATTAAATAVAAAATASGAAGTWTVVSSNTAAASAARYLVSTSGGAVTMTLPAAPATGTYIQFADAAGTFATNNMTIGRNGLTIMGLAEDMTVGINNASFALVYSGSTWRLV